MESNSCSYFLPRKNRFCKMKPLVGMTFCPQHSSECPQLKRNGGGKRIPCPLDPSHSCYLSKVEQHKKKCNAREKDKPVYYFKNVNAGIRSDAAYKVTITDASDEELIHLIHRIKESYKINVPPLSKIETLHALLEEEMAKSDGTTSLKHMRQQASLLSVMEQFNLLTTGSCFIEFGAGKGQLMYWVIQTAPDRTNKTYVLVDKASRRYKYDNKFKQNDELTVERLRIDIEHLFLGKVPSIRSQSENVVGISKHLCGAANDLALRCMLETLKTSETDKDAKNVPLGLVMALCCHHRCTWNSYVGKEFIINSGFTERDFQLMCSLASWATSGIRKTIFEDRSFEKSEHDFHTVQQTKSYSRYTRLCLPHEEREEIGRQCKRLLDMGRVYYLKQHGLHSELVIYVDSAVSLENIALIGVLKGC